MSDEKLNLDSLDQQTKLIEKALKYTKGNLEKAKQMISGQNNDVMVIKGRFAIDISQIFGIFIIFVNTVNKSIMNLSTFLIGIRNVHDKARIFDNWKNYYSEFNLFVANEGDSAIDSYEFKNMLSESLAGYDVYSKLSEENFEMITKDIREIIGKFYSIDKVQCQIEIDETSSLAVDLEGVPLLIDGVAEGELDDTGEESEEDALISKTEGEAEYIVGGKIIVSPVKGKYINDIEPGESIRVLLTKKDSVSMSVAKTLNAINEKGDFKSIRARVKEKIPMEEGGFIIYGVVAKNVLVKIVEEENVKIEMDTGEKASKQDKAESKLIIYIALLLGLIFITLLIIFNIIK